MKCAIYARYSSEEQAGSSTIESQIHECQNFIARNKGWEEVPGCVFVDEAKSGASSANREEFNRMLALVRSGNCSFNAIVVWNRSRFSRNPDDIALANRTLRPHGVKLLSASEVNDLEDGENPDVLFMHRITDGGNEWFLGKLSKETKRGQKETALEGFSTGGSTPFGYKVQKVDDPRGRKDRSGNAKQKSTLVADPLTAPVIRRIFEMYLEGNGHKAIVHQLNSQGAVSPLGKGWDTGSINYILRNETYLGKRIYGKTKKIKQENGKYTFRGIPREKWVFKENAHEAIIPQDLWDKVQARRQEVGYAGKYNLAKPRSAYTKYLLTGMIQCAECGARFVGNVNYGSKVPWAKTAYYRCGWNHRRGSHTCGNGVRVNAKKVEELLVNALNKGVITPENVEYLIEKVNELLDQTKGSAKESRQTLEARLSKVESEITNLVKALQDGGTIFGTIREALGSCEERKRLLLEEQATLNVALEDSVTETDRTAIERHLSECRAVLLDGPREKVKEAIKTHVDKIIAYPDGSVQLYPMANGLLNAVDLHGPSYNLSSQHATDANAFRHLVDCSQIGSNGP